MSSRRMTLCTGAAAFAALAFPAAAHPACAADEDAQGTLKVTPSSVTAGEDVGLRVDLCGGRAAVGTSRAFVVDALFAPAADGALFAEATVKSSVAEGTYDVEVACAESKGRATGTFTVVSESDEADEGEEKAAPGRKADPDTNAGTDTNAGAGEREEGEQEEKREQEGQREPEAGNRPMTAPDEEAGAGSVPVPVPEPGERGEEPAQDYGQDQGLGQDYELDRLEEEAEELEKEAEKESAKAYEPDAEHHASPTAPVRAGGGGTARLGGEQPAGEVVEAPRSEVVAPEISGTARLAAEAAADDGPGTPHSLVGLALAGAAVTAVAGRRALRNRRGSGGAHRD